MAPRTCCKCGQEFHASDRRIVCDQCRRPKVPPALSFRERQIVTLIHNETLPNKEIAFRLKLREGTVKEYLNRVFRKTQVTSRLHLLKWAHEHPDQLVEPQAPGTPDRLPGTMA